MQTILLVILLQAVIFGAFCSFIAKEKNRDSAGWFFSGFFFSIIALLALIAIPTLDKTTSFKKPESDLYCKPIPRISSKQRALRLLYIFLGLVVLVILIILLEK
ncbi:MAG: hypothetical protein GXX85_11015 [Ignavibacteria bacterium]|nr:hypothetical protein [Ignavibacteria bacterium]